LGDVTTPTETPHIPLARLFAVAYRQLIDRLHEELRTRGWTDVRPSFGFVLLAVRDDAVTATALATLLGTTKQATSKLLDSLETAGYVQRADADDCRQRPVELTTRGRRLLATVEDIYTELENEWAAIVGDKEITRMRSALTTVLTRDTGGRLPPIQPTNDRP
jgi:DNA-binding MarR family transcriptional regulator